MHRFAVNKKIVYCSTVTTETNTDVLIVHSVIFIILVVAVFIYGLTLLMNKKSKKRLTQNVSEKYQARENLRALEILAPLLVFHFIGYLSYFAISIVIQSLKPIVGELPFRVIYSATYFISYYCVISPLLLLHIMKKKKAESEKTVFNCTGNAQQNKDAYFQSYNQMWR
ncbi:unnamed protein product [Cylicocyclus nassatus]|uniref:Uncharacterized protein n=1 Tax=Cylicocyclus nassatus TaxID=53992 RepID=A0AA36H598_CYLNA|nr:unnamed protein product [Cylicocyclus nassatus]